MTNVYLLDVNGNPLMPCHNGGFIRKLLKQGKAKVVRSCPFTVQLLYEVRNKYKQDISLGVDSGYTYIGLSATTKKAELFSAEIKQDCGMVERNNKRVKYRRQRRNRLRYRKVRFDNRVHSKPKGWIAPSLKRKSDTHLKLINLMVKIMPISKITVEIGLFDSALLKATIEGRTLEGIDYQNGEQAGYENLCSYIRHRDNFTCQNPSCKCHELSDEQREKLKYHIHHIGYWKKDRTNRPGNLIYVCELTHTPKNHKPGGFLYGLEPVVKPLKEPAFMNIIRKDMVEQLKVLYPNIEIRYTYGYRTNITRREWHIGKSHHDDAYCIAGNRVNDRCDSIYLKQRRRNNRSLEKFYDAKYIDSRDGKRKSGSELFSGRTTRSKSICGENQHVYRQKKVSKGKRTIRRTHYKYQPQDIVLFEGERHKIKGTHCKGTRVILDTGKSVSVNKVTIIKYSNGLYQV